MTSILCSQLSVLLHSITEVLTIAAIVNTEFDMRFVRHDQVNQQLPQSDVLASYMEQCQKHLLLGIGGALSLNL